MDSKSNITIFCKYDVLKNPAELLDHPKNRNKHGQDQIERLSELYKYHGIRHPIIVSNLSKCIVAGHGRKLAALRAGIKEVPVVYQDFESSDAEYAFIQSDNAIALWAELDLSGINNDLQELGPDFDLNMLGIKDFVLEPMDKYQDQDADAVPEVPKQSKSKLGDLYELGNHRLLCGDSTDKATVDILMNGEKADITFTSPPYNLGNNAKLRGYNGDGNDSAYNEKTDHKTQEQYLEFLIKWTNLAISNSNAVFSNIQILAGNKFVMSDYWGHFKKNLIDIMIWDKEHAAPAMAARVLNSVWEFIFIFSSEHYPKRSIKTGKDFRGTIPNIYRLNPVGKKDPLAKDHGAVFPVQFAEFFVNQFSTNSVLDLFGGSGSTLIACEKTNRKCFMCELDPHYIQVIIERYIKFTGRDDVYLINDDGSKTKWSDISEKR